MEAVAHFDRVARIYRPMEYLSFGRMLERCRIAHLPALGTARRALVLGDGDGRFTARLLQHNAALHVDAVDASPAMLQLLRSRVARIGAEWRLNPICCDARTFTPSRRDYDLVVAHFFLDCLTAEETAALLRAIRPSLASGARWLVSEFAVPERGVRAHVARMLITSLYAAFRVLTGLRVRSIPPWRKLLAQSAFAPASARALLGGVLVSELWTMNDTTAPDSCPSHRADMAHQDDIDAQNMPGIDPGPLPAPEPPEPEPIPAPGPPNDPDPQPYPGPLPAPQPLTRKGHPTLEEYTAGWRA